MSNPPPADPSIPSSPVPAAPATGPTTRRNAIVVAVLLLAVVAMAVVVLLRRDDDSESSDEVLVGLVDGELVHVDADGDTVESFPVDLDVDVHPTLRVVGHHLVGVDGDEVVAIDARDGEVERYDGLDEVGDEQIVPVRGSRSLVAVGRSEGTNALLLLDVDRGTRVELAAEDDGFLLPAAVAVSPDGRRAAVSDIRAADADESPTSVVDLESADVTRVGGLVVGLTDDRVVTRQVQRPTDDEEPTATLHWFDHSGEPTAERSVDPATRMIVLPEGDVVLVDEDGVRRVREGDDEPEELGALDDSTVAEIDYVLPMLSGSRLLVHTGEDVVVLDSEGEELARVELTDPLGAAGLDPDARCVSFGVPGREGLVIDLETGEAIADGTAVVAGYSVGPDRCAVALEAGDGAVTLSGSDDPVTLPDDTVVLRVADDGRSLVAGGRDGTHLVRADGSATRLTSEPARFEYMVLG